MRTFDVFVIEGGVRDGAVVSFALKVTEQEARAWGGPIEYAKGQYLPQDLPEGHWIAVSKVDGERAGPGDSL